MGQIDILDKRLSPRYGSHLSVLLRAISLTKGDVLELGMGLYSTPVLHHICVSGKRHLTSYETNEEYVKWAKDYGYECKYHNIFLVGSYDAADIEKPWDVVLIDHDPSSRRRTEIRRLANLAKYIVIHDSNGRGESHYHYHDIFPLFKYQFNWSQEEPHTTVLSNLVDLKNFWYE